MINKKVQYVLINKYKHGNKSEEEIKKIFNQKLLKVIISTEKNSFERCNS